MKYFTNHCWINESIYDNKGFDGEVIVSIHKHLDSPKQLSDFTKNSPNLDWVNTVVESNFIDKKELEYFTEIYKKTAEEKGEIFNPSDLKDGMFKRETVTLKQEVIDWLNDNLKDVKGSDENTPIEKRKSWGIGSQSQNSKQSYQIDIVFTRQLDALEFIKQWSVYKKPTIYFDYFHDDKREMDNQEFIDITNKTLKENNLEEIDFGDISKIKQEINTDLNVETFKLIDWENNEEMDF